VPTERRDEDAGRERSREGCVAKRDAPDTMRPLKFRPEQQRMTRTPIERQNRMKSAAQIARLFKRLANERYYETAAALVAETIARQDIGSATRIDLVSRVVATITDLRRSRRSDLTSHAAELYASMNDALARIERGELGKISLRCLERLEAINWGELAEEK
jgi:hypothetical protein